MIASPSEFSKFEKLAAVLFERQAQHIDRYAALRIEIDAYNQLVQRLYPHDYPTGLRVDAHHIIEERTYTKFARIWQSIGWRTSDDMAAIGLMYEFHIRSPKTLPGLRRWAVKEDVKSLTNELKAAIPESRINKLNTVYELLNEYEEFYRGTPIWKDVKPVLRGVRGEIHR
jgi:hypothetical protein